MPFTSLSHDPSFKTIPSFASESDCNRWWKYEILVTLVLHCIGIVIFSLVTTQKCVCKLKTIILNLSEKKVSVVRTCLKNAGFSAARLESFYNFRSSKCQQSHQVYHYDLFFNLIAYSLSREYFLYMHYLSSPQMVENISLSRHLSHLPHSPISCACARPVMD